MGRSWKIAVNESPRWRKGGVGMIEFDSRVGDGRWNDNEIDACKRAKISFNVGRIVKVWDPTADVDGSEMTKSVLDWVEEVIDAANRVAEEPMSITLTSAGVRTGGKSSMETRTSAGLLTGNCDWDMEEIRGDGRAVKLKDKTSPPIDTDPETGPEMEREGATTETITSESTRTTLNTAAWTEAIVTVYPNGIVDREGPNSRKDSVNPPTWGPCEGEIVRGGATKKNLCERVTDGL
jgi:hypothetical protein